MENKKTQTEAGRETDRNSAPGISGITPEEIGIARHCVELALSRGASQVRVSLGKNTLDSIQFLNGEVDKVSHCADRGLCLTLFADGRYGTYSTNRLDAAALVEFIDRALESVRMLAPDPFRRLPAPEICAKGAVTGNELGLADPAYESLSASDRLDIATKGSGYKKLIASFPKKARFSPVSDIIPQDRTDDLHSRFPKWSAPAEDRKFRVISEECEWTDSTDDSYLVDSQGFEGRHRETSFNFWTEMTVEDSRHRKYSGYHWESSPFLKNLNVRDCSPIALRRACDAIGPKAVRSGKYTLVVENTSASRLVAPILNALSATAIQQNNSFLADSLGRKVFPDGLNVFDFATTPGHSGSRLFDSEGLATKDRFIIRDGVVQMYFVNTYMSGKMGLEPTVEGSSRPTVLPYSLDHVADLRIDPDDKSGRIVGHSEDCSRTEDGQEGGAGTVRFGSDLQEIMENCGEGILVTGFNGGNCSPTTGNFSYGVEGFLFRDGRILHPVKEMLITGDMITLWNSLLLAGADAREGTRWQIPTLAFSGVDFSA